VWDVNSLAVSWLWFIHLGLNNLCEMWIHSLYLVVVIAWLDNVVDGSYWQQSSCHGTSRIVVSQHVSGEFSAEAVKQLNITILVYVWWKWLDQLNITIRWSQVKICCVFGLWTRARKRNIYIYTKMRLVIFQHYVEASFFNR